MRILFVCTGNTCRSPLASVLANKLLPGVVCTSAGLNVSSRQPASDKTIHTAAQYDVDLTGHLSIQVTPQMLEQADVILTMTNQHKQQLCLTYGKQALLEKCFTLAEFAGEIGDIPDPFGQPQAVYDRCGKRICALLEKIKQIMEGC